MSADFHATSSDGGQHEGAEGVQAQVGGPHHLTPMRLQRLHADRQDRRKRQQRFQQAAQAGEREHLL